MPELGLSAPADWCELVKDLIAIGIVLIGLDDNGNPAPETPAPAMAIDPVQTMTRPSTKPDLTAVRPLGVVSP